jgi:hypothetical protein
MNVMMNNMILLLLVCFSLFFTSNIKNKEKKYVKLEECYNKYDSCIKNNKHNLCVEKYTKCVLEKLKEIQ